MPYLMSPDILSSFVLLSCLFDLSCRSDVTERLVEHSLYTGRDSAPDMLIRTSGVTRLSDFLLWQSAYAHLVFLKAFWPEFSLWNMLLATFHYQRSFTKLQVSFMLGLCQCVANCFRKLTRISLSVLCAYCAC